MDTSAGQGKLVAAARRKLIAAALRYPESHLDHPWGEDVVKVRARIFVFFGVAGPDLGLGVKLPSSATFALMQPFCVPSGYNLGRSGWVSATFHAGDSIPVPMLEAWIEESYRAVAPRSLVARLGS